MKLDHQLTPYTKRNSRSIKDLNVSRYTIKMWEENIGRKMSDIPCSNILTDTSPKARDIKERINKWDLIKIKSFCKAKENSTKIQREPTYGKTYLPMIPQTRAWSPKYIRKSHDSPLPSIKTNNPIKKLAKDLNRHFSKEDIQRAQRHMKRCSASLAIREMKIKTTVR